MLISVRVKFAATTNINFMLKGSFTVTTLKRSLLGMTSKFICGQS